MSSRRQSPFAEQPPEQPHQPGSQQPEGPAVDPGMSAGDYAEPPVAPSHSPETVTYPEPPSYTPGEFPAPPTHDPYGELPEEDQRFMDMWAVGQAEAAGVAETDEAFLGRWTAQREDPAGDAEQATTTPPETDKKPDTRAFRRTKKGFAWLGTAAAAAVIGFGGSAVADQVIEQDGIFATDSRETGEAFIAFQETVAKPAEYAAEGMLAIGGLVVSRRIVWSAGRATKRAYRAKFPKKDKKNEGDSSEAES